MGKNGAAMRAAKEKSVTYTFTKEQLREHDIMVIRSEEERLQKRLDELRAEKNKELDEYLTAEWKKREELFAQSHDSIVSLLGIMLSVPARILVEKFGWEPVPKDWNGVSNIPLARFSNAIVDEINSIAVDDAKDIRKYCEETYEKCGVKYAAESEEENNGNERN